MSAIRLKKFAPPFLLTLALSGLLIAVIWLNQSDLQSNQSQSCDLNLNTCTAEVGDRTISLTLNPAPAKSLTPLTFTAEIKGNQPEAVWLDIQGEEMYMGLNQPEMRLRDGRWSTQTELAVCTTGRMRWKTTLVLVDGDTQSQASFYFDAE